MIETTLAAAPPRNEFEGLGDGPLKRSNFFLTQRAYPAENVPAGGFAHAVAAMQSLQPVRAAETQPVWQNIGPAPMVDSLMGQQAVNVSGRVRALAIHPQNPDVVYLGAAQGGVWKTTNGGNSWTPLSDDQASLAIAAIALDPSDPEVVYAGTGEPTPGLDNYYGAGILKSTTGGQSWTRLGAGVVLTRIEDNSFPTGYVGLANWFAYDTVASAAYDNFKVNRVEQVYADSFTSPTSGWFEGSLDICQADYGSGVYNTAARADYICYFRAPSGPQPNGRFTTQGTHTAGFYPLSYGLFFGEDGVFGSSYAFFVDPDTQRYALTRFTTAEGWLGITWDDTANSAWLISDAIISNGNNQLTAERDGNLLRIWINGVYLGGYIDPSPLVGGYFGLITSASQFEEALTQYDSYSLTAWESPPPQAQAADATTSESAVGLPMPEITRPLVQE